MEMLGDMSLSEEVFDVEDEERVALPDLFKHVRPLIMREDGSPRLIVRIANRVTVFGQVTWPVSIFAMYSLYRFTDLVNGARRTHLADLPLQLHVLDSTSAPGGQ